jgi:hypothetical protein
MNIWVISCKIPCAYRSSPIISYASIIADKQYLDSTSNNFWGSKQQQGLRLILRPKDERFEIDWKGSCEMVEIDADRTMPL